MWQSFPELPLKILVAYNRFHIYFHITMFLRITKWREDHDSSFYQPGQRHRAIVASRLAMPMICCRSGAGSESLLRPWKNAILLKQAKCLFMSWATPL